MTLSMTINAVCALVLVLALGYALYEMVKGRDE
jgi:hypothetical protein